MFIFFKNQSSKTILNKKLKLVFLFLFTLGLLFNASPTQALFGVGDFGIFDVVGIALDALDFIDSAVIGALMSLLLLMLKSTVLLSLSTFLLQWAIDLPVNLSNEVVIQGWNFIAGISNAFLALVLVFIALSYILKIETFEAKKALPKLILIALLINFSKVFVGIFVDIAEILQNTISGALGENFISLAMSPLETSGLNLFGGLVAIIVGYSILALVPFANVVALMALLTLFITGPLFQFLGNVVLLILFNFASGTIFLLFTALFLMRIAMIWILTIFAPLAFVASILKPTKKHWDKWLKTLIEWSFLGIVNLFLLGLGLKFLGAIIEQPAVSWNLNVLAGNFEVPEFIYYYLFLLVYLGVVFHLSKQNMPEFAQVLIDQGKTLVKGGAKLIPQRAKDRGTALRERVRGDSRNLGIKIGGKIGDWGKRGRLAATKGEEEMKKAGRVKKWAWATRRGIGTRMEIAGGRIEAGQKETQKTMIDNFKKEIKGKPEEKQFAELQSAIKNKDIRKIIGTMEAMTEDNTLGKAEESGIFKTKDYQKYVKEAEKRKRPALQLYDIKSAAEAISERWDASNTEIQKEIISEMLTKIKPSDVKLMSEKSLTDDIVKKAIINTFNGNQIAEIGKNFGMHIMEGLQGEIERKKTAEKVAETNPSLALWLHGNTAQNLGFKLPGDYLGKKEIKEKVIKARQNIKKRLEEYKKDVEKNYQGIELLMARDYHSKNVSQKRKNAIKEILIKKGKKIPQKTEIDNIIQKNVNVKEAIKIYDLTGRKAREQSIERMQIDKNYREAGSPSSGNTFNMWIDGHKKIAKAQQTYFNARKTALDGLKKQKEATL